MSLPVATSSSWGAPLGKLASARSKNRNSPPRIRGQLYAIRAKEERSVSRERMRVRCGEKGLFSGPFRSLFQHLFRHVDGQSRVAGNGNGDGVRGTRIDLDDFPLFLDSQLGEVDMVPQLADLDAIELSPELFHGRYQQLVR